MKCGHCGLVLSFSLLLGVAPGASAEADRTVAGPQYGKGGLWRFWFGDGYRNVWTTPVSGIRIDAQGFYMPQAWDVKSAFGGVDGSLSGYLGSQTIALAVRGGGRKLWGEYPWFESASIGGGSDLRGYYDNRFRGDSSVYASAELRLWMGHHTLPDLPLQWGLFGFGDTGRVWLAGESSKEWHTDFGGGVVLRLIGIPLTVSGSAARSTEGTRFDFYGGYSF